MGIFARAVITGFGFSLGNALFKRVQEKLGLTDDSDESKSEQPGQAAPAAGDSDDPSGDSGSDTNDCPA